MRFLKTLTLNRRAIYDDRLAIDTASGVVMNTPNSLLLPKGTTAQQPLSPVNGMIRYNTSGTTGGELEAYQASQWRPIRFKEPNGVVLQDLSVGDDVKTIFGPLNPDPMDAVTRQSDIANWNLDQMAVNLLVITETIVQLGTVNFDLVTNPSSTGTGAETLTGSFTPSTEYIITFVGDTDFTAIGASANTVGTVFTATGIGGGTTGLARQTGTYIEFYSAVPLGRTVHALHKFNQ